MSSFSNWSKDSQTHAQICILESQIEKRNESVETLKAELTFYKNENKRLLDLVNVLTGIKENLNTGDVLDRFK